MAFANLGLGYFGSVSVACHAAANRQLRHVEGARPGSIRA